MRFVGKLMAIGACVALSFSLVACASQESGDTQEAADAQQAEEAVVDSAAEDGQNPIMNFVGPYACDRASMLVEADGMDGARVSVTWGSSAAEHSEWAIEGSFDPETLTINYENATRTDIVFNEAGDVESEEAVYTDGTGSITFQDDGTLALTWNDEKEHAADGMVFEFSF